MDLGLGGVIAAAAVALLVIPLLIGGVLVILVVANRADPDPSGRRPAVVYSYATSFITLFVTLFATFVIVARLTSLIGPHHTAPLGAASVLFSSSGAGQLGPEHPFGDAVARGVVIGALLAIVAGFVYLMHVRAADRATDGVAPGDPAGRVRSSYLAAVSFVCVAIIVVSVVVAAYQVFRIIAPGVFNASGGGNRLVALRVMLPLVYLAVVSLGLLWRHAAKLPPESRPSFGRRSAGPWSSGPAPVAQSPAAASAPVAVVTESPAAAPQRKQAPAKRTPAKRTPAKRAATKRAPTKRASNR
jgi:hypothetical protein